MPKHREFGFFQGHFDYRYLANTPLFVVRNAEGNIVAFINEVPSYLKGEANFDMMRHLPGVHWGIMDYLFMELMLTVQKKVMPLLISGLPHWQELVKVQRQHCWRKHFINYMNTSTGSCPQKGCGSLKSSLNQNGRTGIRFIRGARPD